MFPASKLNTQSTAFHNARNHLLFAAISNAAVVASIPSLPATDDSSSPWTLRIRAAAENGRSRHALSLYILMLRSGHRPDPFAVAAALKSCGRLPFSSSVKPFVTAIHAQLHKLGFRSYVHPQTALADVYSKLDGLGIEVARKVFDEMPTKNVVSWNAILSSCLRAGDIAVARRVFDEMPARDIVSWNTMASGYAKAGDMDSAAEVFQSMPEKNPASWNGMMSGYIARGNMSMARELFDEMPVKSNVSWLSMISGYSQCGDVGSARDIFDRVDRKDLYVWNSMIACYAQNGRPREAIHLFNKMRKLDFGVQPDEMTFSSVLSACSQLGILKFGMWIQEYMHTIGIEPDDHLSTALIDLCSKCGEMESAFELFNGLRKRDVVSYSAMILGCGINGRSSDATCLFEEMLDEKIAPNAVTFAGLLTAYNHAGLVEEARRCFASMSRRHKVMPSVDHYAIMVDLLGRNGRLEEAFGLIKQMPMPPHSGIWGALLLAARLHGNVELGEIAARNCFKLEPDDSGYYVQLAGIYAEAGKWDKAKKLRRIMLEKGLAKTHGCSWFELT